ncbi:hypothetical protein D3C73_1018640 [compost metagenome]
MGIKNITGLSRLYPAFGADQQLLFQLSFQRRQLLAESRLGDMQHFCRLGQAADVDDFHEILKTSEIHTASVMPLGWVEINHSKIRARQTE